MIYTGIGSRETPKPILKYMIMIAFKFAKFGWTLRSGGAAGADSAFEFGCDLGGGSKEIYLPWKDFNGNTSKLFPPSEKAIEVAKKYHPKFSSLSSGAKKLHARNSHQILGVDCSTPAELVICWTPGSGGTEQALRIARDHKIEILNLYHSNKTKLSRIPFYDLEHDVELITKIHNYLEGIA